MAKIIISYRRIDAAGMVGRIFDRLVTRYGKTSVFMDIDNIPYGIDFRKHIQETLQECDMVLAVVGPRWLGADTQGSFRINNAADPVRVEIETALRRGIPLIPVWCNDAGCISVARKPKRIRVSQRCTGRCRKRLSHPHGSANPLH
jgi:hypothetical protein